MKTRFTSFFTKAALALLVVILAPPTEAWAQWSGSGDGTLADPYQISSYAHLKQFAAIVNAGNTSANAKLVNDIVCKNSFDDQDYATDWTPIGNSSNEYTGTFDGRGYAITGLSTPTNNNSNYVGLFGYVGSEGVVQNVTLVDAALYGKTYIGGVVGYSSGTVKNAVVSNSRITGQSEVGGVVGFNAGNIQKSCLIGSSSVISNDNNGGGIVGYNGKANGGIVENCYVTLSGSGSISAVGNFAGGIVGYHYRGTVANCHYSGAGPIICTSFYCGGIVGNSYEGNVHCCYYAGTGAISSSNYIGAIIANNNYATVQNCYYNKNNTTVTNAIGDFSDTENVKGLTTAQFQDMTNFSGFDSDKWIQGVVSPLLKGMPYTITFDANGGEGGMDNQTVTSEDAAALRTNTFTRSGYHFIGWNTKADGTGIDIAANTEARLVGPETLYAQWCGNLIHHPAVEVACLDPGNSAYWECTVFHKYFSDENGENEIVENSWVIDPLGHDMVEHAAVAPTCTTAGHTGYRSCIRGDCYTNMDGDNIAANSWVIPAAPATGHNFENDECTYCHKQYGQGTCGNSGDNVTWSYDASTKELTISGTGAMMYYGLTSDYLHSTAPWNHLDSELEHVVINDGVTSVGSYAFAMCGKLVSVSLPASVFEIDQAAFYTTGLTRIDIPRTTAVTLGEYAFSYCHNDLVIAVPSTLLGTYQTADNWSTYADNLVGVLNETTGFGATGFATGNYEYTRTFKCGTAATLCLPFDVTAKQAGAVGKFYTFNGIDKSGAKWEVIMQETAPSNLVEGALSAHTPYLFMPYIFDGKSKGDAVELTFSGTVSTAADASYASWTEDVNVGSYWTFQGVYYNLAWNEGNENIGKIYGFAAQNYDGGSYTVSPGDFVKAAAGASIAPFRAYLQYYPSTNAPRFRGAADNSELPSSMTVRLVDAGGIVTAVGTLNTKTGEVTFDDSWYDMNGRKLNSAPKARGIYINNGKKVIVK